MTEIEHQNCLLEKSNVNVETKGVKKYDKHPLKTLTNTTKFGYVPNGKKIKIKTLNVEMQVAVE
jgi:hypothetical protein